jgi:hypothetical protein
MKYPKIELIYTPKAHTEEGKNNVNPKAYHDYA